MHNPTYLHVLDGRMRIKVPKVKNRPRKAAEMEQVMRCLSGVTSVSANPVTGNILILFDSSLVSQEKIIQTINSHNCLQSGCGSAPLPALPRLDDDFSERLIRIVVECAVETAIKRLVFALL